VGDDEHDGRAGGLHYTSGPMYPNGPAARPAAKPRYANWPLRVVAFLVDGLVFWALPLAAFVLVNFLHLVDRRGNPTGAGSVVCALAVLAGFLLAACNVIIWQGRTGHSLGKRAIGARLVSIESGRPLGAGVTAVRQLCHILNAFPCYLGYLWPLWDARSQTFADKIVRSVVVRDQGAAAPRLPQR
jgi:uncharacterized RDD family membrane protein YckC